MRDDLIWHMPDDHGVVLGFDGSADGDEPLFTMSKDPNPFTMSFSILGADPKALAAYYGGDIVETFETQRAFALTFETATKVSGEPEPPGPRPSFWKRQARRAWRQEVEEYREAWEAWDAAGRPAKDGLVRTYIPRAVLR